MEIRLVFATPDEESLDLFYALLSSALKLTPLHVTPARAANREELLARADEALDDVVVLDWLMSQNDTPALVRELLVHNPKLRIVATLPLTYRQYRQKVWSAGACSSIAKEHMEQEWFSSVLCIMYRAMEREARLLAELQAIPHSSISNACCA